MNVHNFKKLRRERPADFECLRFDPNNNCNVQCVYCHNHRNDEVIATDEFARFLDENIRVLRNFQMGCIMEPTLDKRLCDLLSLVSTSRVPPENDFVLQTNGILLHMHDFDRIREAGVNRLTVSIDAADPAIHKALRGGTSIAKVSNNIRKFSAACPKVKLVFITTVTQLNAAHAPDLVRFGIELGVCEFVFREVFYLPENDVVDHSRMPQIVLKPGQFATMARELRDRFGSEVAFDFADDERLAADGERMRKDSMRPEAVIHKHRGIPAGS